MLEALRRAELERRVDELAETHSGKDFAQAVRRLSGELDQDEREELKAVLLERARLFEDAIGERFRARGWMQRTLARIEEIEGRLRSPPGNRKNQ